MRLDNIKKVPTPCYVIEEGALIQNLKCLKNVMDRTGAHILLAQKAFSTFGVYPLIAEYLSGTTASGLYEARLGAEEMPDREVHVFQPAYRQNDIEELVHICDHIVFNSVKQWNKYKNLLQEHNVSGGIRVNPEYSEVETEIYDPCGRNSRLGVTLEEFQEASERGELEGLEGIHFHTMCEQGADVLARTLVHVEEKFGPWMHKMKWLNFGGGHHITREDYDVELLVSEIKRVKETYDAEIYLEPGEAVALNAGVLISQVLEVREKTIRQSQDPEQKLHLAILDTSAACHMPDVLEMPYRPRITGSGEPFEKKYTYLFGGPTCLAGDQIGTYSFDEPLEEGACLEFQDMAIYSMVKNNTFNGMPLPEIFLEHENGSLELLKSFGYEDFKCRLGDTLGD